MSGAKDLVSEINMGDQADNIPPRKVPLAATSEWENLVSPVTTPNVNFDFETLLNPNPVTEPVFEENDEGVPIAPLAEMIDPFFATQEQRRVAFWFAERFAERAIRVWGLKGLRPCWRLHEDVMIDLYHLERAWSHYHQPAGVPDGSSPTNFRRAILPGYEVLWGNSPMSRCEKGHIEPLRELASETELRRSFYDSPREFHTSGSWPLKDPGARDWDNPAYGANAIPIRLS
jgi:hypothetical protein